MDKDLTLTNIYTKADVRIQIQIDGACEVMTAGEWLDLVRSKRFDLVSINIAEFVGRKEISREWYMAYMLVKAIFSKDKIVKFDWTRDQEGQDNVVMDVTFKGLSSEEFLPLYARYAEAWNELFSSGKQEAVTFVYNLL